ncbi:hypothetical protein MTP99_001637 [Tenebrio molitor]|nr:hypothetical protein MTP99_001637 [Tenebrio molitor]
MFSCMDNPSFHKDADRKNEKGIELSVSSTNGGASSATENLVVTCTPEVCRTARQSLMVTMYKSTEILTQRNGEPQPNGSNPQRKPKPQQVLVGWDKQKTFTFLGLSLCFVVWACVYFPLIL